MPPRDTITRILAIGVLLSVVALLIIIALRLYGVLPPGSRAGSYALITIALLGIAMVTNDPSIAQRYPSQNDTPTSATARIVRWLLPIAFFAACLLHVNGVVILTLGGSTLLVGLVVFVRQIRQQLPDVVVWPIAAFCTLAAIIVFGMMLRLVQEFGLL